MSKKIQKEKTLFPVSFEEVTVRYRDQGFPSTQALKCVSVPFVCESQRILLSGPNAAGKSTLIGSIAGIVPVTDGHVRLPDGNMLDFRMMPRHYALSYVPQNPADGICPSLTIYENMLVPTVARQHLTQPKNQKRIKSDLCQWLEALPGGTLLLDSLYSPPSNLSGGFLQLLCLAAHLYSRPDILLLDEPTSKIAPGMKRNIWDVLSSPAAAGLTIICASHDLDTAREIMHREVSMDLGIIAADKAPELVRPGRRGELVHFCSQLPHRLLRDHKDWWKPNRLFGESYERGDNSKEGYLQLRPLTRGERTQKEVNGIISIAREMSIPYTDKDFVVLDCPCGYGRHSITLAKLNVGKIYGVDINDDFLTIARLGARGLDNLTFLHGDMRSLPNDQLKESSCNIVLNLYTSFGFFSDHSDNLKVLKGFYSALKKNGVAIVHFDFNPRAVCRGISTEPAYRHLDGTGRLFVREIYCAEDKRLYGIWDVRYSNGEEYSHNYSIRAYDEDDWILMGREAGFQSIKFFGALDQTLSALSEESTECVVVLTK